MSPLTISIIIFVISLVLYVANVIPMALTAMLTMMAFVFTGCLDAKTALAGFSNANTIVIASMLVVAAGFNKTQFVDKMSRKIVKLSGGSMRKAWAGYILLASLVAALIPSPMAAFAVVFPLLASTCREFDESPSKYMFALAVTCICFTYVFPFGNSINRTAQNNGYFEAYNMSQYVMKPMDWLIGRWPMAIGAWLWAFFVAPKTAPQKPLIPISADYEKKTEKAVLPPVAEWAGVIIFFAVIVLMLFSTQLGLANWQITTAGALLMVLFGTLKEKEAYHSLPFSVLFVYVGGLAAGNALVNTGAGDVVGGWLATIVGNTTNSYVLGGLFFIVPFILTQFMMNSAVVNLFTPLCLLTCASLGANPIGPCLLVVTGAMTAFMTPLATPAIPMCMGVGGYDQRSLFKMGWLISVILAVTQIFWVMTMFPAF